MNLNIKTYKALSKKDNNMSKLDAFFKFKENNTDVKTEIIAGITIFLAMAYILIVNPAMLSETGMDIQGVFIATALSAAIATILMGYIANYHMHWLQEWVLTHFSHIP